jgi:hypothetical protein
MAMFWLCGGVFSRAEGSVGEFFEFRYIPTGLTGVRFRRGYCKILFFSQANGMAKRAYIDSEYFLLYPIKLQELA